jgi:hypothetical protein
LGTKPEKTVDMLTPFLKAVGFPSTMIKKARASKHHEGESDKYASMTKKRAELHLTPVDDLIRQYINEEINHSQFLYRLDAEICKSRGDKSSSFLDKALMDFLVELSDDKCIPMVTERLKIDYFKIARTCNGILHRLDLAVGEWLLDGDVPPREHWTEDMVGERGYGLVYNVLWVQDRVEADGRTSFLQQNPKASARGIAEAKKVFTEFLQADEEAREAWII